MKVVDFFALEDDNVNEADGEKAGIDLQEDSNETALKPSQDEKRLSKHTKVLIVILAVAVLCVTVLAVVLIFWPRQSHAESESLPKEIFNSSSQALITPASEPLVAKPQSSQQSSSASQEPAAPPIPKDEWYMTLVNAQFPLPDGFDVETQVLTGGYHFDARAIDKLKNMLEGAERENIKLKVVSASRSAQYQKNLYDAKVTELKRKGQTQEAAEAEASRVTGKPYECEHNLALAADIIALNNQRLVFEFDESPEFLWLMENAHSYGFILRYPKDKEEITGVQYEPWHWRYVGEEQAKLIKESGLCLEEYLNG